MIDNAPIWALQFLEDGDWYFAGVFDDKDLLDEWVMTNLPPDCTTVVYPGFLNHPPKFGMMTSHHWRQ